MKLQACSPATLFKKILWRRCFPVDFAKFLRISLLQNTSGECFWKKKGLFSIFSFFVRLKPECKGCVDRRIQVKHVIKVAEVAIKGYIKM